MLYKQHLSPKFSKEKFKMIQDRYERGVAKLKEFAGDAGDQIMETLKAISPDFERYSIAYPFGDIYSRPGLDIKSRQIATIAALTALNNKLDLKAHLNAALHVGLTREEIVEVLVQMSIYAGFPAAVNALIVAQEVFKERDEQGLS
jgi:4-carboxymuconolactone decarboxylase